MSFMEMVSVWIFQIAPSYLVFQILDHLLSCCALWRCACFLLIRFRADEGSPQLHPGRYIVSPTDDATVLCLLRSPPGLLRSLALCP